MPSETQDVIEVTETRIACEGAPGPVLGHPKVWLDMGDKDSVECPYCGRKYVLKAGAGRH